MHLLIVQEERSLFLYDTHYVVRNIILDFIYTFLEMLPFGNYVMERDKQRKRVIFTHNIIA